MNVTFPYTCGNCGKSNQLILPENNILLNGLYFSRDCQNCKFGIGISPTKKISDAVYEYSVRTYKIVKEEPVKTPI